MPVLDISVLKTLIYENPDGNFYNWYKCNQLISDDESIDDFLS